MIQKHRNELELIAKELLEKEVIYKTDLERLIGPRPVDGTHLTEQIPQVVSSEPVAAIEPNTEAQSQDEPQAE